MPPASPRNPFAPADEPIHRRAARYASALLLARIYEVIPLRCPQCGGEMRVPPGNRLDVLKRDRLGQHSIRVNDQFRVCFVWTGTDAENVEIVDYQ